MSKWSNIRKKIIFIALNFNMIWTGKDVTHWLLYILFWHNTQLIFEYTDIVNRQSSNLSLHWAATSGTGQVFETPILFVYCFTMSVAGGSRSRDNWWRGGHSDTPSLFLFLFGAAFGNKNVIQCDSDRLESQRSVTSIHSPGQNMIQCITDWMEYVISRNGAKFLILIVPRLLLFPAFITTQHIY